MRVVIDTEDDRPYCFVDRHEWNSLRAVLARIDDNVAELQRDMSAVRRGVTTVERDMSAMDDALAAIATQVQANTDAEDSAAITLDQIAALLQQNATNPQVILDLATKLKAHADPLAAAIVRDTPAATPPAP